MTVFRRIASGFSLFTSQAKELTKRIVSHSRDAEVPFNSDGETTGKKCQNEIKPESFSSSYFSATFWLYAAVFAFFAFVIYIAFPVVTLILASYIISVAIEGPIRFIKRLGLNRGLALFFCYVMVVVLIVAILMVIPFVAIQLGELLSMLLDYAIRLQETIQSVGWVSYINDNTVLPPYFKTTLLESLQNPRFASQLQAAMTHLVGTGESMISSVTGFAIQMVTGFLNIISRVLIVVAMSVFFSIEKSSVLSFVVDVLSKRGRDKAFIRERVLTLYSKLQLWLKGQLFLMLYVGIFVFAGLSVLGLLGIDIPQKWLLALMAGVTEIVPYIGPILGGIPAFLVASLSHGIGGGIAVLILFALVQWTENNIVVPVVMNKVLGVNPLLIFVCMLLGGWVLGFVGMVLAVPIAVILTVLYDKTYK